MGGGHVELQVGGDALPDAADSHGAYHAVGVDSGLGLEGGQVGDAALDNAGGYTAEEQSSAEFEDRGNLRGDGRNSLKCIFALTGLNSPQATAVSSYTKECRTTNTYI